jgi:integrase
LNPNPQSPVCTRGYADVHLPAASTSASEAFALPAAFQYDSELYIADMPAKCQTPVLYWNQRQQHTGRAKCRCDGAEHHQDRAPRTGSGIANPHERQVRRMARRIERKGRLPKTKTPEEWSRFFACIDGRYDSGKRSLALFRLLYASALRVGEALQLEVADLDLELLRVHVRAGKTGERWVPLPDDPALIRSINAWLEVRSGWNPSIPLLFATKPGKPLSTNAARESMKLYGERAGIGHVHPHMLRHSAATELLSKGAAPLGVQRILGHRQLSTLLNTYAHACDTHAREAMAKR